MAGEHHHKEEEKENEGEHGRHEEGTDQTEVKVVGEYHLIVEEKDASGDIGNENQEREDTVCVKSVESLPVLGTLPASSGDGRPARGSHCPPWALAGSWVGAP